MVQHVPDDATGGAARRPALLVGRLPESCSRRVTVLNKMGPLANPGTGESIAPIEALKPPLADLAANYPNAVFVSAERRWGLEELGRAIGAMVGVTAR